SSSENQELSGLHDWASEKPEFEEVLAYLSAQRMRQQGRYFGGFFDQSGSMTDGQNRDGIDVRALLAQQMRLRHRGDNQMPPVFNGQGRIEVIRDGDGQIDFAQLAHDMAENPEAPIIVEDIHAAGPRAAEVQAAYQAILTEMMGDHQVIDRFGNLDLPEPMAHEFDPAQEFAFEPSASSPEATEAVKVVTYLPLGQLVRYRRTSGDRDGLLEEKQVQARSAERGVHGHRAITGGSCSQVLGPQGFLGFNPQNNTLND
ncbi:MAG: hypothetical protein AAF202_11460, partial [Pseudomonadota bacterium]